MLAQLSYYASLCLYAFSTYYAQNYASIIRKTLLVATGDQLVAKSPHKFVLRSIMQTLHQVTRIHQCLSYSPYNSITIAVILHSVNLL